MPVRIGNFRNWSVEVGGNPVNATLHDQTIKVPLGRTVGAGGSVSLVVRYTATFRSGTGGHDFLFTSQNSILSAYRWIPWISRDVKYQPLRHGDPFVTPVSPRVKVKLRSDVAVRWGAAGRVISSSAREAVYLIRNVRDFNFTASRNYARRTGMSTDGSTRIIILTRTLDAGQILGWARKALERFGGKLGPYPYASVTIAEASGGYAMESPGLIWLPYGYGRDRTPYGVVHELAHQWFYGVVGNDQTTNPFMDEATADFLARWLLGTFRASRCGYRALDLSMYAYSEACYYEQIYLQGSALLNKVRGDMGNRRFWAALRGFAQDKRFEITTTRALLEALRRNAGSAEQSVLSRFRHRFPHLY